MLTLLISLNIALISPIHAQNFHNKTVSEINKSLAVEKNEQNVVQVQSAQVDNMGFFEKYFPWQLEENLHPTLKENQAVIWILLVFFGELAGPLWIPKVITDLDPGKNYMNEAIWFWLTHMLIQYVSLIPFAYLFGIGFIFFIAQRLWFYPVATINYFNRFVYDVDKNKSLKPNEPQKKLPKKGEIEPYYEKNVVFEQVVY